MQIKGITLFIFGGVAEMEEEPQSPNAEFFIAIVGPIASATLAATFYAVSLAAEAQGLSPAIWGVPRYLALANGVLAVFNLVPGFPLDGGRVLRALLWHLKGDVQPATRIASRVGAGFGAVLMALGALMFITGNLITGVWWFLIGMFLRGAATASYKQTIFRRVLEGEPVRRFMTVDPIVVRPNLTVRELVEDYMFRHYHELFPVTQDSRLLGYVSTHEVRTARRDQWDTRTVREMMIPSSPENTIQPEQDAVKALMLMRRTGNSRLMVAEGDRLIGIIALKDLLRLLALKMDLETET